MAGSRLYINVSAIDYDKASKAMADALTLVEQRTGGENEFTMTDSEFAFGWHFFVIGINRAMIDRLADQMGPDFEDIKGKGPDKKFVRWLEAQIDPDTPRFKIAIKEEMESSKFGLF